MSTLERNRVFEQQGVEESRRISAAILEEAETTSAELAALAREVQSLCARVPSEAAQPGLSGQAGSAAAAIQKSIINLFLMLRLKGEMIFCLILLFSIGAQ